MRVEDQHHAPAALSSGNRSGRVYCELYLPHVSPIRILWNHEGGSLHLEHDKAGQI